ncbi:DUF4391 domain-containing protein [Methanocorpusculum sp. MG]|uniref:DUF4391 domain-containing protein n=1 Tax=Methanocorpusculum petauri TaxID=3002863 RepID=A0ABT4IDA9_9EURY|nr:DUF4391 domain-containing protein [Methanocorpusculum petauri]MCZ0859735.1 DUF4391 domain-containing protein [Methanocorpusculum petauri]
MSEEYGFLQLPESCVVDKTVFKKDILDGFGLATAADKRLFSDVVEKVVWRFCLRPDTIRVAGFVSEVYEYPEVEILEVRVGVEKGISRIAEIMMRAIPYPMILVFRMGECWQFWVAHQRVNLQDRSRNTLEEIVHSGWVLSGDSLFARMDMRKMRFTNYFTLYSDVVDALSVYCVGCEGGVCSSGEAAREMLREAGEIDAEISRLRAEMRREDQFNRRMELHVQMMELKKRRERVLTGDADD